MTVKYVYRKYVYRAKEVERIVETRMGQYNELKQKQRKSFYLIRTV